MVVIGGWAVSDERGTPVVFGTSFGTGPAPTRARQPGGLILSLARPRHGPVGVIPSLLHPTHSSLPYPTLPYPTLPYPTLPYPTLPYGGWGSGRSKLGCCACGPCPTFINTSRCCPCADTQHQPSLSSACPKPTSRNPRMPCPGQGAPRRVFQLIPASPHVTVTEREGINLKGSSRFTLKMERPGQDPGPRLISS